MAVASIDGSLIHPPYENLVRDVSFQREFRFANADDEGRALLLEDDLATRHKPIHGQCISPRHVCAVQADQFARLAIIEFVETNQFAVRRRWFLTMEEPLKPCQRLGWLGKLVAAVGAAHQLAKFSHRTSLRAGRLALLELETAERTVKVRRTWEHPSIGHAL